MARGQPWTPREARVLQVMHRAGDTVREIAQYLERDRSVIRRKVLEAGLQFKRLSKKFTADEDKSLRINYPKWPAFLIAHVMGRTRTAVHQRAHRLGLKKSPDFYNQWHTPLWAAFETEGSKAARFKKGQVPPNKGVRRPGWAPGRMAETQFKKGRPACEARNYVPIGSEKIDTKRNVLVRKITDDPAVFPVMRWRPVHVMVWEAVHGPVPEGHIVRFKDGQKTFDAALITEDRLELVTLAENMRRNTIHNYPPEIKRAMQMRGVLNRAINRATKKESNDELHDQ